MHNMKYPLEFYNRRDVKEVCETNIFCKGLRKLV